MFHEMIARFYYYFSFFGGKFLKSQSTESTVVHTDNICLLSKDMVLVKGDAYFHKLYVHDYANLREKKKLLLDPRI